jgi:hypothetical protein
VGSRLHRFDVVAGDFDAVSAETLCAIQRLIASVDQFVDRRSLASAVTQKRPVMVT